MAGSKANYGATLLMKQLRELSKNPNESFSVGMDGENIFKWNVLIVGPPDSLYEGGFFKAVIEFPDDFPNSPPVLTFTSKMYHPNIYPDGKVCISILHPPGEDKFNEFESAEERWRPIIGIEAVLISVVSMLSSPNINSPANIDASKMFRDDLKQFKRMVRRTVQASMEE